jgi:fructose transport system ATP-binding protein
LEVRGVAKHFGRVVALREANFELRDGEVHAIVGDNGAGKSTLIKIVSGVFHPDAGELLLNGKPVAIGSPREARALGIETVYQDLALAEEEMRHLKIGMKSVEQPVLSLSGGQRQAVAVARAIAWGTRIVIMDEPTAALGVRESGMVLELIKEVRSHGIAVIMISHNLPEVFAVADRITTLRLGRTISTLNREDTSLEAIVAMMTGAVGVAA